MNIRRMNRIRPKMMAVCCLAWLLFLNNGEGAYGFDPQDVASIGAAYTSHIFLRALGHEAFNDEVGSDFHRMRFFTHETGTFYPELSLYENIPGKLNLSYVLDNDLMTGFTSEYALQSYRRQPTTFNKALMFFSGVDFFANTFLFNRDEQDNDILDPDLDQEKAGFTKGMMLSMVAATTLLNAYRVMDRDANFIPMISLGTNGAFFMLHFDF